MTAKLHNNKYLKYFFRSQKNYLNGITEMCKDGKSAGKGQYVSKYIYRNQ